jgi:hypothetical protein
MRRAPHLRCGKIAAAEDVRVRIARIEALLGPHVEGLLRAGLDVVLDVHANTVARRTWVKGIVERSGASHRLHRLDVPDATCLARLHARSARDAPSRSSRSSRSPRMRRACARYSSPSGVSAIRRVVRATSATPSARSIRARWRLTAGVVTPSSRAAASRRPEAASTQKKPRSSGWIAAVIGAVGVDG